MKTVFKFLLLVVLVLSITGCTQSNTTPNSTTQNEEAQASVAERAETITGNYIGLADNNFFEIEINGEYKVFMITDDIRDKFERLNLKTGETVMIRYLENQHGQNEVLDIQRLNK
jgi:predicted small lipoprotein YifL